MEKKNPPHGVGKGYGDSVKPKSCIPTTLIEWLDESGVSSMKLPPT